MVGGHQTPVNIGAVLWRNFEPGTKDLFVVACMMRLFALLLLVLLEVVL